MGTTKEDAAEGANTLTMTDLRGVETHGVSNMLRSYVESYTSGHLNPRPDFKVVRDKPSMATVDADKGLAVILGPKMMRMAIEKAKVTGVGVVTLYNSGHSGGIGHHAMLAAEQDMVGMVLTSGGKSVLPTFGAETRLGTNPIALAAPARNEPPFLFDAATSAVAGNKTGLARRVGTTMLPGWLANLDGSPMDEPALMMEQGSYHLLPLGSTREQGSHKGYGLGMIVEIMATLLSGVAPSMLDSRPY
jgi:LDH2 family malate/lactate/ureidoglycolate dehydrogenase